MSLFSAEARPAGLTDLAGLLCGPGRIERFGAGDTARFDLPLPFDDRERALTALAAARGVALAPGASGMRSAFRKDLVPLARTWCTPDGHKQVPPDFQLDGATLRLWVLAAGVGDLRGGHLLLLDPDAPWTHGPLIAAATRAGLPPARLAAGEHGAPGPALRLHGARRMARLAELVGPAPRMLGTAEWPRHHGRPAA
ncbi:hypothetical protein SAMN05216207_101492 [Pseudonocardia ammonioxydans]|uniref:Uncharacterized protein n=1 Tax=Pseudonocardia ammonioxydans TaxID=260086 RepID=A0A1I4Z524_PSUAM|nr:hypothetical protein [Pseudonocardia ammonioxydans]SFN44980.1 hypothetical protein SAMN05216207_101492 [Pseudonocardia ammonioxydans]